MVNVVSMKKNTKLIDSAFSLSVNLIQKIIIDRVAVKIRKIKSGSRSQVTSSQEFKDKLLELGISPEKLWWGLMVLHPSNAEYLLDEIERQPPKRILDVGCGTSTALFAAAAEKYNFNVLGLENYYETVKYVEYLLRDLNSSNRLTIQHCNLVRAKYENGDKYRWYNADLNSTDGLIDFVLIDGPMSSLVGRNGALPKIIPYLAEDHRIFMDDSTREHELKCIMEWKKHYPQLIIEHPIQEKTNLAKIRIPNIKSMQSQL